MKYATVGDVQKNFSKVLGNIQAGEEIIVTKRGVPVARIIAEGPKKDITWPDFYEESIELKGDSLSSIVIEDREDRF